ncbi:histidine phosphatase family protein [Oricola cellulosilytica]|uniref:Histidine phosphatase family protein n=1 Tax=Oricola cellulosilytica TaxID=1429082 RepID=A0A4R0P8Q3_9HYPH|nr:histidine phosphatase family protein [Oricola cellulosilytica]TCD13452.1 histidine phosphatase family protein [Oricola cellulosilytica]
MARSPFYMIRHGETDWNREGRYQGTVDIPLNARGHRQAERNGALLASLTPSPLHWRFISSPLGRARHTMEIIRSELGLPPDDYLIDQRLIEITFGKWEQKCLADLKISEPQEVARREQNKWVHVPPGGESYADAAARMATFFDELAEPSVIVCHGGIIRATRFILEDLDGHRIASEPVPQDKVYAFDGSLAKWIA